MIETGWLKSCIFTIFACVAREKARSASRYKRLLRESPRASLIGAHNTGGTLLGWVPSTETPLIIEHDIIPARI